MSLKLPEMSFPDMNVDATMRHMGRCIVFSGAARRPSPPP